MTCTLFTILTELFPVILSEYNRGMMYSSCLRLVRYFVYGKAYKILLEIDIGEMTNGTGSRRAKLHFFCIGPLPIAREAQDENIKISLKLKTYSLISNSASD
jgi:hypothetical protein